MESPLARRLADFRREVDEELAACGRAGDHITIVGVTKKHPAELIREAAAAGVTDIGENYVQEARTKFAALLAGPALQVPRRHFIGHLQTNKAKAVVEFFDIVQTVDRAEAAAALAKAAAAAGKVLPILVQINVSPSERFGCPPEAAERLAEAVRARAELKLDGVMAVGPITKDRGEIVRAFELAAKTFGRVGGSVLSIGMSSDWREALRAGSTMIRIGTALFGERVYEERGVSPQ